MPHTLLIAVRLHDDRYHGTGDWPPAPARLFQALIAGIGQSGPLTDADSEPLDWLQKLPLSPVIAAPTVSDGGQAVPNYVPNNQLDAHSGDPRKLGLTRDEKVWKPKLFQQDEPLLYAWTFPDTALDNQHASSICRFADHLYQLGRGIDLAWAYADILAPEQFSDLLAAYPGTIHRPTQGSDGTILLCPRPGSLQSLKERHAAMSRRFQPQGQGKSLKWRFTQPPQPLFRPVAYDCPPIFRLFDLTSEEGSLAIPCIASPPSLKRCAMPPSFASRPPAGSRPSGTSSRAPTIRAMSRTTTGFASYPSRPSASSTPTMPSAACASRCPPAARSVPRMRSGPSPASPSSAAR